MNNSTPANEIQKKDGFLDRYKMLKMTPEKLENQTGGIVNKGTKIKNPKTTHKDLGSESFTG